MLSTIKVPGGKLLQLRAEMHAGKLSKPKLTGDFFLMPSEKIIELERAMEGSELEGLAEKLEKIITQHHIELVGISTNDIERAARMLK